MMWSVNVLCSCNNFGLWVVEQMNTELIDTEGKVNFILFLTDIQ